MQSKDQSGQMTLGRWIYHCSVTVIVLIVEQFIDSIKMLADAIIMNPDCTCKCGNV